MYFPTWGEASEKLVPIVKQMLSKDSRERPSLNEILASPLFSKFRDPVDAELKQQFGLLC